MTITGIGIQTENLQVLRAQNAFRKTLENLERAKQNTQPAQEENIKDTVPSRTISQATYSATKIENQPDTRQEDKYVSEIKDFINKYNLTGVEEDDIQSALKYGTSLLADYIA
jgi:sugar (pentulose or hexulose) kinase